MKKLITNIIEGKKEQPPVVDQSAVIASLKNQIEFLKGQVDFYKKECKLQKDRIDSLTTLALRNCNCEEK